LGAQMIEAGDARGWLHIFDEDLLIALTRAIRPPATLTNRRPVLGLAVKGDSRLRSALHAEVQLWHELDRARLGIYQRAVRPYMLAIRRAHLSPGSELAVQYETRVRCAEHHLPLNPLADYGLTRVLEDARAALAGLVNPAVNPATLGWLPDVREHFKIGPE
jgi:hypothetical protein